MLRRTSRLACGLKGNNVIGIRREDKNIWERRVPLVPKQVKKLVDKGVKVLVQPCNTRCYSNDRYEEVGAVLTEDLSPASTILAVKEVPPQLLIPERTYMYFSHTIKAQPENMAALDTVLAKKVRLIDYECISNSDGRLVKFGPFAGYAGMIDTLHGLGLSLLYRGISTPFLHISLAKEYRSLEAARADAAALGNVIREEGLPREICPLTFVITGTGSVSMAAQQVLHGLPCNYVDANDLAKIWQKRDLDRKSVYVAVASPHHLVQRADGGAFNKAEYYNNPELYVPTFHKNIAPYCRVLVNGMYWEPKYHKLLTKNQITMLHEEHRLPMLAIGDITCDIMGSNEMLVRSTSIADPLFCYDLDTNDEIPLKDNKGSGVVILGVDHLPAEFPEGASESFGAPLIDVVAAVAVSDGTKPVGEQGLPEEIAKAVVTNQGELTPEFSYITELRKANRSSQTEQGIHSILIIGAGMMAGPVLEHLLLSDRNHIVIADASITQAEQLINTYVHPKLRTRVTPAMLDVTKPDVLSVLVQQADVVVSLLPAFLHHLIIPTCIEHKKNIFTASYPSEHMWEFDEPLKQNGLYMLNELGLDPGIDIMSSLRAIATIQKAGGIIQSFRSTCGALPSPAVSDNPMGYKFSWSPQGVLRATNRPAQFRWKGKEVEIPGQYIYDVPMAYRHFQGLHLWSIPNGDSLKYGDLFGLNDGNTHTLQRATFRFNGFARMVSAFRTLGLLGDTPKNVEPYGSWRNYIHETLKEKMRLFDSELSTEQLLEIWLPVYWSVREKELSTMANKKGNEGLRQYLEDIMEARMAHAEAVRVREGMTTLGLLSNAEFSGSDPMEALCNRLTKTLRYAPHESDFVLLVHEFQVFYPASNTHTRYTCRLSEVALDDAHTATNRTVGLPCAIAVQAALDGKMEIKDKGILSPITPSVYGPILTGLKDAGIMVHEKEKTITTPIV